MTLENIARKICEKGKGILAADESTGTMDKRLKSVNINCTVENRLKFRETLFSSVSMKDCIGGVILFDETIRQKTSTGISIPELITKHNSIPGIKVDKGAKILAGSDGETVTEGLDGLRDRLKEYYSLGAKFTKWRAVYNIKKNCPSSQAIKSNAHALARYAALVQESNMVPIVEPEVLMDGEHTIENCFKVSSDVLSECYNELEKHKVDLRGTILKPNMIVAGKSCKEQPSSIEIAKKTLECLKKNVPDKVPGIAFLSGGQSEVEASKNLNEINKINDTKFLFTFSYGRALQQSALKHWSKNVNEIQGTQKIFNHRANLCTLAAQGKWSKDLEIQS